MLSRAAGVLAGLALLVALAAAALLLAGDGSAAGVTTIVRASLADDDTEANQASEFAAISADGRYVAFTSTATDLVPNDTIGIRDIFVRDRFTGATERISNTTAGLEPNNLSDHPSISADGRYVAFASDADNLVSNDGNDSSDVFVRDRVTDTTTRVSVASDGSEAGMDSETPAISGDGRYVAFTSLANDLVPSDGNMARDVFVHDRMTGVTEMVSVSSDEVQGDLISGGLGAGPARISLDGRYVVFGSFATNLVALDENSLDDIFVRDRMLGTTVRASVGDGEEEGNGHSMYGSISDDGRYVAFHSLAANLTPDDGSTTSDVFLRDLVAGTTTRISEGPGGVAGNAGSSFAVISADGGAIAFQSLATNLVADDGDPVQDVFRHDVGAGTMTRVSVDTAGGDADADSSLPSINGDGTAVAFRSLATDLIAGDGNGVRDVFVGFKFAPAVDGDGDGCTNAEELGPNQGTGGRRDPKNPWDFFDTPPLDRTITIADIVRIVGRFGANVGPPPTSNYDQAYDRSLTGPDLWDLGPPNGSVSVQDISFAVTQFGHNCQGPT
jgi:Tol biopolymer transport system component